MPDRFTPITDIVEHVIDAAEQGGDHSFTYNGAVVAIMNHPADEPVNHVRLYVPHDANTHDPAGWRDTAYDIVSTAHSETTNDDPCDIVVRERSAHLGYHDDVPDAFSQPFDYVVIDAVVLDALS